MCKCNFLVTQSVLKISKQYCNRVNSYNFILVPASIDPCWTRHTPELIAKLDKQSSMKVMLVCAEHACIQTEGVINALGIHSPALLHNAVVSGPELGTRQAVVRRQEHVTWFVQDQAVRQSPCVLSRASSCCATASYLHSEALSGCWVGAGVLRSTVLTSPSLKSQRLLSCGRALPPSLWQERITHP